jgi:hypothetical protein
VTPLCIVGKSLKTVFHLLPDGHVALNKLNQRLYDSFPFLKKNHSNQPDYPFLVR